MEKRVGLTLSGHPYPPAQRLPPPPALWECIIHPWCFAYRPKKIQKIFKRRKYFICKLRQRKKAEKKMQHDVTGEKNWIVPNKHLLPGSSAPKIHSHCGVPGEQGPPITPRSLGCAALPCPAKNEPWGHLWGSALRSGGEKSNEEELCRVPITGRRKIEILQTWWKLYNLVILLCWQFK